MNHLWRFAAEVAVPGEKQGLDKERKGDRNKCGGIQPSIYFLSCALKVMGAELVESHLYHGQLNVRSVINRCLPSL